jgi:hypothetical protein
MNASELMFEGRLKKAATRIGIDKLATRRKYGARIFNLFSTGNHVRTLCPGAETDTWIRNRKTLGLL